MKITENWVDFFGKSALFFRVENLLAKCTFEEKEIKREYR
jgi:hypothetical protein